MTRAKKETITEESAAREIVAALEKSLALSAKLLVPRGHDDREALQTALSKALTTARNVLESESRGRTAA